MERVGVKSSGVVWSISDCVNIGIVRKWGIGNAIANNLTLERGNRE
ncbi:MAG: hypothetical protein F6K20_14005 [Moorea sp. SIO2C4]|nr:hypothetical protein [Moorena sp. SIO2C4]